MRETRWQPVFPEQTAGLRIDRGEKRESEVDLRWSGQKSGPDNADRARPQ
mgnify:CR=1 FL=1